MLTYEIRLLNAGGGTVMIHVTSCDSTEEARGRIDGTGGVAFDRFEIWQDGKKVAEGPNPNS